MSEHPGRDRHRRQTLILIVAVLVVVLGAIAGVVATAGQLDRIVFLHFPLGFYLLAQGLLIVIVAAGFWSVNVQDRIDRSLSESEEV